MDNATMAEDQNLLSANFMIFGFHLKLVLQAVPHMISLSARFVRMAMFLTLKPSSTQQIFLKIRASMECRLSKCLSVVINR